MACGAVCGENVHGARSACHPARDGRLEELDPANETARSGDGLHLCPKLPGLLACDAGYAGAVARYVNAGETRAEARQQEAGDDGRLGVLPGDAEQAFPCSQGIPDEVETVGGENHRGAGVGVTRRNLESVSTPLLKRGAHLEGGRLFRRR